jgi:hypothetical protein
MGKGSTYGPVRWAARNGDLYRSRRDCIWLALSVAALLPFRALGESLSRVWRMGFLAHGHESFYDALFESLAPLGYVEGKNLIVERRYAEGHPERFAEFAADMVRLKADIIIVATTPAVLAVKSPTTAIPVVFPNAISPVESGVVASLANPGGNITGGAAQTAILSTKRLAILKEVLPTLSRGALLWNAANPALAYPWKESQLDRRGAYFVDKILEGRQARRSSGGASHKVRTGAQSEGRKGFGPLRFRRRSSPPPTR